MHCETATGDNDGVSYLLAGYDRVQVEYWLRQVGATADCLGVLCSFDS